MSPRNCLQEKRVDCPPSRLLTVGTLDLVAISHGAVVGELEFVPAHLGQRAILPVAGVGDVDFDPGLATLKPPALVGDSLACEEVLDVGEAEVASCDVDNHFGIELDWSVVGSSGCGSKVVSLKCLEWVFDKAVDDVLLFCWKMNISTYLYSNLPLLTSTLYQC